MHWNKTENPQHRGHKPLRYTTLRNMKHRELLLTLHVILRQEAAEEGENMNVMNMDNWTVQRTWDYKLLLFSVKF